MGIHFYRVAVLAMLLALPFPAAGAPPAPKAAALPAPAFAQLGQIGGAGLLAILDISQPLSPTVAGSLPLALEAVSLEVDWPYVYAAYGANGLYTLHFIPGEWPVLLPVVGRW
jgi:hypothetical protein